MKTGVKIAIAAGATIAIGVVGLLIYNSISKKNEAARKYLGEVDENGGAVPSSTKGKGSRLSITKFRPSAIKMTAAARNV